MYYIGIELYVRLTFYYSLEYVKSKICLIISVVFLPTKTNHVGKINIITLLFSVILFYNYIEKGIE